MITERKVVIYEKYNGFVDGYIFENGDLPNDDFDLNDWTLIEEIIGNIILLKTDRAAIGFQNELANFIKRETENNLVIQHLTKIAEKRLGSF